MDSLATIKSIIADSILAKSYLLKDIIQIKNINKAVQEITLAFKKDKKLLLCGNGGSAADAQHLAAEFTGRFGFDRAPLFAEALHVNTSYLTAVANDYSFDKVYSRLVQAKGKKGDVLIGISTSGRSKNIIKAIRTANKLGLITIGLTGSSGGEMKKICKYLINVPSDITPRIQELHILVGHIICEMVETNLFPR